MKCCDGFGEPVNPSVGDAVNRCDFCDLINCCDGVGYLMYCCDFVVDPVNSFMSMTL